MVALPEIFGDHLPVGVDRVHGAAGDAGVLEPVRREKVLDVGGRRVEIGRILGKADEDQPAHLAEGDRVEAECSGIDPFGEVPGVGQRAVETIRPGVIGADQPLGVPVGGEADPRTAVTADIVITAGLAPLVAQHHDRIVADFPGEVVPGPRNPAGWSGQKPVAAVDGVEIGREGLGIDVEPPRQAVARKAVADTCGQRAIGRGDDGGHGVLLKVMLG